MEKLKSYLRFLMTLRSREGVYHSLILFRLSAEQSQTQTQPQRTEGDEIDRGQIYVMEASCPHLGADMSHAEIEECETGIVAVCPWHR